MVKPSIGRQRLCFKDQAPAIGSGWRVVEVKQIGYKWVHLRNPYNGRGVRMRRARFDEVWEGTQACIERNTNVVFKTNVRRPNV